MPSFGLAEHPFVTWDDGFTEDEIKSIISIGDALEKDKATIHGADKEDDYSKIRESSISWIEYNQDTGWIYDRLAHILRMLNGQFYRFDIYGFSEHLQYTVYNGEREGHYTWHLDSGFSSSGHPPRKLSLVLQLSDSSEYEGGDLEILTTSEPQAVMKKKGLVAVFPSYVLHRVTPVTKGIRRTLVVWSCGPTFR
jgi:PKHD-type hydroxylase